MYIPIWSCQDLRFQDHEFWRDSIQNVRRSVRITLWHSLGQLEIGSKIMVPGQRFDFPWLLCIIFVHIYFYNTTLLPIFYDYDIYDYKVPWPHSSTFSVIWGSSRWKMLKTARVSCAPLNRCRPLPCQLRFVESSSRCSLFGCDVGGAGWNSAVCHRARPLGGPLDNLEIPKFINTKWRFPKVGLPPVLIHLNGIFHSKSSSYGVHLWNPKMDLTGMMGTLYRSLYIYIYIYRYS